MSRSLSKFVGAVQLRLKIEEATSTKEDATPIYLLDEVAQMTGRSADGVNTAVDVIVKRLKGGNPDVKLKTLRLVKHMSQKGSSEFKLAMSRQSGAVRELVTFRCAPDPFRGDLVWKRVQETAQQALDALHAAPPALQPASQLQGRIQGFGSENASGGFAGGSYSSGGGGGGAVRSGMVGFGSESFRGLGAGRGASGAGGSGNWSTGEGVLGSLATGVRSLSDKAMTAKGYHGLLAEDGAEYSTWQGAGGGAAPEASSGYSPSPALVAAAGGASAASAASAEERLVGRLCTPAGLRAAPEAEDLRAFVESASSLDGSRVAQLLEQRMERGPWQAALRALCALEAVIEQGSSAACGEAAVHFQGRPAAVRAAAGSPHASVRQRAQRVLTLLGADTLPDAAGGAAVPDLMRGLADEEPRASASAATTDLLGGLADLAVPAAEQPGPRPVAFSAQSAALPADLLAGLLQPVESSAAAPAAGGDDLFAGLAVGGQPPSTGGAVGTAPPPAGPAQAPLLGLEDLMTGLAIPSSGGAQPSGANGAAGRALPALGGLAPANCHGAPLWQQQQQAPVSAAPQPPGPAPLWQQQPALSPAAPKPLGSPAFGQQGTRLGGKPLGGLGRAGSISQQNDAAFSFVEGAMGQMKKK